MRKKTCTVSSLSVSNGEYWKDESKNVKVALHSFISQEQHIRRHQNGRQSQSLLLNIQEDGEQIIFFINNGDID